MATGMPRKAYVRHDDGKHSVDNDKVSFLLMDREQARLDKDFKTADAIREQLEELGVTINDAERTWAAGPKPEDKGIDLNSVAVTAALTLHPVLWISDFGEASEQQLNTLFREEFPNVAFRMAREKLEGDSDEEDTRFGGSGLESLVMREAGAALRGADEDEDEPQKRGKALGYGHIQFANAEQAKDFAFRFEGFPFEGHTLKVRVSKQSLAGSLGFRSRKLTHHDLKIKQLRKEERSRIQDEKDAFAAMQARALNTMSAAKHSTSAKLVSTLKLRCMGIVHICLALTLAVDACRVT